MRKTTQRTRWILGFVAGAFWTTACGGTASNGDDNTGDGDGDLGGDGDVKGVGGTLGDGDGDGAGVGGTLGDGDGDGDVTGVGGTLGDGDGDGDVKGVGGTLGDGDGDIIVCTDVYLYGLNVVLARAAYPPPPKDSDADTAPAPGAAPPGSDRIAPPSQDPPDQDPALPCEGVVVAVDGGYMEQLACEAGTPRAADCTCFGAGERPGTYTVTATWGHLTEAQEVTLGFDGCHVIAQSLIFFDD